MDDQILTCVSLCHHQHAGNFQSDIASCPYIRQEDVAGSNQVDTAMLRIQAIDLIEFTDFLQIYIALSCQVQISVLNHIHHQIGAGAANCAGLDFYIALCLQMDSLAIHTKELTTGNQGHIVLISNDAADDQLFTCGNIQFSQSGQFLNGHALFAGEYNFSGNHVSGIIYLLQNHVCICRKGDNANLAAQLLHGKLAIGRLIFQEDRVFSIHKHGATVPDGCSNGMKRFAYIILTVNQQIVCGDIDTAVSVVDHVVEHTQFNSFFCNHMAQVNIVSVCNYIGTGNFVQDNLVELSANDVHISRFCEDGSQVYITGFCGNVHIVYSNDLINIQGEPVNIICNRNCATGNDRSDIDLSVRGDLHIATGIQLIEPNRTGCIDGHLTLAACLQAIKQDLALGIDGHHAVSVEGSVDVNTAVTLQNDGLFAVCLITGDQRIIDDDLTGCFNGNIALVRNEVFKLNIICAFYIDVTGSRDHISVRDGVLHIPNGNIVVTDEVRSIITGSGQVQSELTPVCTVTNLTIHGGNIGSVRYDIGSGCLLLRCQRRIDILLREDGYQVTGCDRANTGGATGSNSNILFCLDLANQGVGCSIGVQLVAGISHIQCHIIADQIGVFTGIRFLNQQISIAAVCIHQNIVACGKVIHRCAAVCQDHCITLALCCSDVYIASLFDHVNALVGNRVLCGNFCNRCQ